MQAGGDLNDTDGQQDDDERPEDVARVVHAGVDPGQTDDDGQRQQHLPQLRDTKTSIAKPRAKAAVAWSLGNDWPAACEISRWMSWWVVNGRGSA